MNPTPPENPKPAEESKPGETTAPSVADSLASSARRYTPANRRVTAAPTSRFYLIALVASTLVAAAFCMLYITKPVVITPPDGMIHTVRPATGSAPATDAADGLAAATEDKPAPASATRDGHEETNLRIQHVLNASTAEGDLSRIVLDVPVIYASRNLRWTGSEVAQAREILNRLADYHEQSRLLRDLGTDILLDWNHLIERSIPTAELRADSPSLPANQEDAALMPRPAILDTTESIEIRPPGP